MKNSLRTGFTMTDPKSGLFTSCIRRLQPLCLLTVLLFTSTAVKADFINLTGAETSPNIAEIYVLNDRVRVVLEVYVGDIGIFEDLVPDDWLRDSDTTRPSLGERMRRFSINGLRIANGNGEVLRPQVMMVEPRARKDRRSPFGGMINPLTRQRVPEAPRDKRVLYAELEYPFSGRPDVLAIQPPLDGEGRVAATIGFIAYHKSVPVIDFRYLGAEARLNLDWDDPWYSRFDNPNLKRHHKSALMSFLYVEPYEVRHEILTRVKDMGEWMDLGLRGDEFIEIEELEPLKQRIGEFLLRKNPVLIDDEPGRPILDRTNYVKVSLSGIQLIERPERLEIATAIVGVIIAYITDGLPQEVVVDWELFTDQVQRIPATATDPAGPLPSFITPDDNRFVWTNFLKKYRLPTVHQLNVSDTLETLRIPLGTLFCLVALVSVGWRLRVNGKAGKSLRGPLVIGGLLIGGALLSYPYLQIAVTRPALMAGQLSQQQSTELLETVLKNVYRAFDFREEADVYDKLALSVDGDLLSEIYLQNRRSFAVQRAGGAQAKIKEIEILQADARRLNNHPLAYSIRGRWSALGTVGHWGHVHRRKNLYEAILTIEAVEGVWKVTGLELLEEQRVDPTAILNSAAISVGSGQDRS